MTSDETRLFRKALERAQASQCGERPEPDPGFRLCGLCGGTGVRLAHACPECGGSGKFYHATDHDIEGGGAAPVPRLDRALI